MAEESLRESSRIAVGTGSLAKGKGEEVARQWQAIAYQQDVPASVLTDRRLQQIEAAGIKVFHPTDERTATQTP